MFLATGRLRRLRVFGDTDATGATPPSLRCGSAYREQGGRGLERFRFETGGFDWLIASRQGSAAQRHAGSQAGRTGAD